MELIRPANVAGSFYPQDPHELIATISTSLEEAASTVTGKVKGIIVPHSGYEMSGSVYAEAYSLLAKQQIDECFVLGFSHYSKIEGVAVSNYKEWTIPQGCIEQSPRTKEIIESDDVSSKDILQENNTIHEHEHTVEVQLPYLHHITDGKAKIIPMLVGKTSPRILATNLDTMVDDNDIVIVSSELSHGYPADYSEIIDASSIEAITELNTGHIMTDKFKASSPTAIATLIELAKKRNWKLHLLKYLNASSVQKQQQRTTGMIAVAFTE